MNKTRFFLWSLFAKGLDFLTLFLGMRAAKTKNPWDDKFVKLLDKIGDKCIPGKANEAGTAWIEDPAMTSYEKGKVARTIGAIVVKELLLNQDFRNQAKIDDMQADRLLIAVLTFLKPDAVDTPQEIQAILDKIKPGIISES